VELWVDMFADPPQMATTAYISRIWPRPLPTIMRRDSTPQGRQFYPMDVTCSRDLVEIWVEMIAAPPPQMTITPYISRFCPRPFPMIMRHNNTCPGHQFTPKDFTRSEDLVELWANMWV
jgi:hypothetical protein